MDTTGAIGKQSATFQATRQKAVAAGNTALSAISAALTLGARQAAEPAFTELEFFFEVVAIADAATQLEREAKATLTAAEPAVTEYVMSSWCLADCASYLLSHPQGWERLILVTGSAVGAKRRTLERMVTVALAESSLTCALAEEHDLSQKLIAMDATWGHSLHGLFHSHPGHGREATRPSGTDRETHGRYEAGGYPLVGAIFERSGFVRFFSDSPFTITLYGKGVEQYEEHLFKIRHVSHYAS
jgi:proteasome lid subunit RPN8/RPN11